MRLSLLGSPLRKQRGAATLFVAVIMLVAITLVALLSGKTVVNETKIAANNYRTAQAVAAANYALDLGINYFDTGGFDRFKPDGSGGFIAGSDYAYNSATGVVTGIDTVIDLDGDGVSDANMGDFLTLTSTDGSQTLSAKLYFVNRHTPRTIGGVLYNGCGENGDDLKAGQIVAQGYSDDRVATRTMSVCVGPINALRDDGPEQPLVAQGQIALTGNARIINRFTSTTIWSGDQVTIGSSSAMETYVRSETLDGESASGDDVLDPDNASDKERLLDTDDSKDAQLVSNRNLGNGLDIIDDDTSLDTLIGIDFFKNFFIVDSRGELKLLAGSQIYADIDDVPSEQAGVIWVEAGTSSMTGGTIGTIDNPATVYINGDFELAGNAVIYGVLYVAGTYTISGTPTVKGANIVEGTDFSGGSESPASPPVVGGNGTISLIYWAGLEDSGTNNVIGKSAVIAGSWRDW